MQRFSNRLTINGAWLQGLGFPVAMWLISRLLVALVMLVLAPGLPTPPGGTPAAVGWSAFAHWDSGWYLRIATSGYEFAPDGKQHSVAFFPLYPLLIVIGATLGFPAEAVGVVVSHLAFLGALCLLFGWIKAKHGELAARWGCAVLAWFPMSLFASLVYTEALFLLLSTGAIVAFERGRYGWAALCASLATATRVTGIALAPAMAWAAWRERRPLAAWGAAVFGAAGLLAFMAYGAWRWDDALAFLHAQQGWRSGIGFDAQGWWGLWREPALWGEAIPKSLLVFGGTYLLWRFRRSLGHLAAAYGLVAMGLILASGSPTSVDRYTYAVVPLFVIAGLGLRGHPRWGAAAVTLMVIMLVSAALRIARGLWVA